MKKARKSFSPKSETSKVCRTQTFIKMMEMQPLTCLNKRSWHCFHPELVKVLAHALHVVWRYLNTKSWGEIEILLIQADGMLNKQTLGFRIERKKIYPNNQFGVAWKFPEQERRVLGCYIKNFVLAVKHLKILHRNDKHMFA